METKLREGLKIITYRDGKKEKKQLKVEKHDVGIYMVLLPRLAFTNRGKRINFADIVSIRRAAPDSNTPRNPKSLGRLVSLDSTASAYDMLSVIKVEVKDVSLSFDFSASSEVETSDLEHYLCELRSNTVDENYSRNIESPTNGAVITESLISSEIVPRSLYAQARGIFFGTRKNSMYELSRRISRCQSDGFCRPGNVLPELPPSFVKRPDELSKICQMLLKPCNRRLAAQNTIGDFSDKEHSSVACILSCIANGKSVLATAVAHELNVRLSSDDTILWLTVGRGGAKHLVYLLNQAITQLLQIVGSVHENDPYVAKFLDATQASDALAVISRHYSGPKRPTLILDDVWEPEVVEAFDETGIRLLVTTRCDSVAARIGMDNTLTLKGLEPNSAKELLGRTARQRQMPSEAEHILATIGCSPLSLSAVGAALRNVTKWDSYLVQERARPVLSLRSSTSKQSWYGLTFSRLQSSDYGMDGSDEDGNFFMEEQMPLRLAVAGESAKLKSALLMSMNALPHEFYEMYNMLTVFPPAIPLTSHLLSALWEAEESAASLMASSMEELNLLIRLSPGVFSMNYDLHAAAIVAAADDDDIASCQLLAKKNARAYLSSFDTLFRYFSSGQFSTLASLWGNFEHHAACGVYMTKLGILLSETDLSNEDSINDTLTMIIIVGEYFRATGCTCSLNTLKSEVSKLPLKKACAEANRLKLMTSLHFQLGGLYMHANFLDESIHELEQCIQTVMSRTSSDNPGDSLQSSFSSDTDIQSKIQEQQLRIMSSWYEVQARELLAKAVLHAQGSLAAEKAEKLYAGSVIVRANYLSHKPHIASAADARCWKGLGDLLRRTGELDRATILYNRALEQSEFSLGALHPVRAACLEGLGKIAIARGSGSLDEASSYFSNAHAIREAYFGESHACVAMSLERQAEIHNLQGDLSSARTLLERCLAMRTKIFGEDHKSVGATLRLLAAVLLRELRARPSSGSFRIVSQTVPLHEAPPKPINIFASNSRSPFERLQPKLATYDDEDTAETAALAEDYLRRAMAMLDVSNKVDATMSSEMGEATQLLYRLLMETGRVLEAEPLAQKWVSWLEKKGKINDYEYSRAIGDLIGIRRYLGGPNRDVESLMYDLLSVDRSLHGPDSLEVAADQDALALVLVEKGRHSQAEPLLRRSLRTRRMICGETSKETAMSLTALGSALVAQHAYRDAEEIYREACRLNVANFGLGHAETIASMRAIGVILCKQLKYADAEPFYKRIVEADLQHYGTEEHEEFIKHLNVLAVLRYAMGRLDIAEPLLRRVLELREKVLGPNHPDVSESLINLAALLNSRTQYSDALPMLERSFEICVRAHGRANPDTIASLDRIAETHQKMKNYDRAEDAYMHALELNINMYTEMHPAVAETLSDLGELFRRTGRLEESENMHRRALAIREKLYGEVHETVAESYLNLSLLVNLLERSQEAEMYQCKVAWIREELAKNTGGGSGKTVTTFSSASSTGGRYKKDPTGYAVNRSVTALPGVS